MKDDIKSFEKERAERVRKQGLNSKLRKNSAKFFEEVVTVKYHYNFDWLGMPIIQIPQDIMAMQEIIWDVKPDLIIETGIARGGSLIFYASMLELLGKGEVVGVDIDIREHNRKRIEAHKFSKRIKLISGSSVDPAVVAKVKAIAKKHKKILVCFDALHTAEHVMKELELYTPFVSKGSYCVVFDTAIEYLPDSLNDDRPWGVGDNPATALKAFLKKNRNFVIDRSIDDKILISAASGGFLKRIK